MQKNTALDINEAKSEYKEYIVDTTKYIKSLESFQLLQRKIASNDTLLSKH